MSEATAEYVTTAVPPAPATTVMFDGHVIVGGVVSTTVTNVVHEDELPLASVAVNVTAVVPSGNTPLLGPETVTGPAMSEAVAGGTTTNAANGCVASAVIAAGQMIVGAVVSMTVIEVEHDAWFPAESVAVYTTIVVPSG